MIARRGRLLPSVIVGALVTGALTLGAGTASAAGTCLLGLTPYPVRGDVTEAPDGTCLVNGVKPTVDQLLGALGLTSSSDADASGSGGEEPTGGNSETPVISVPIPTLPTGDDTSVDPATPTGSDEGTDAGSGGAGGPDAGTGTSGGPVSGSQTVGGGQAPSGLPAPDVRGAVAAPALAAPGGLAAARMPLLNFGTPNPALLLAPPGSPLRTIAGENTGSPVTTTSDVQAMAFDNLPGGMGTPAVIGVLILSTLGAFALRHRILRRARSTPSDAS
ncbi:hypothetical protein [Actinomycetospora aeridis]|uniref:Secreted protein n=1 Tax=Actinomycetospora aeridis TaxID=3129231 RepID=A0ABU8NAE7_9PSEU